VATPRPEDVLHFWLGAPGDPPLRNSERWFAKDPAFDAECAERFGPTIEAAARGQLAEWRRTPRGRLALVIVLDQLPRNVFRDTPRAFAQDALARDVVLEAMTAGDERVLSPIERSFLYMPLMHAEDVGLQHRCVAAFGRLAAEAPADLKKYLENCLDFARRHEEIVERFGRFPHRNRILGRASTGEEERFLQQPNSSF
jgi:uncharacterized protein (DUF924 family)